MKKTLIFLSILIWGLVASAESFRFVQWSGRLDVDGLNDLSRMAVELFPTATDDPAIRQQLATQEGRQRFEKLKENVLAFVKSKGFYLQTEPLAWTLYLSYVQQNIATDIHTAQTSLARVEPPHPLVEQAIAELFSASTEAYFSTATSKTTYKVVDSLIAFIPIVGAFYGAKRIQDSNFGPVADAEKAQAEKYEQLQKCAYAESLETPNNESLIEFCQNWAGRQSSDGRKSIDRFREILDYAFLMNLMIKVRLGKLPCTTASFGGNPQAMSNVKDHLYGLIGKHRIQSTWLMNVTQTSSLLADIMNQQMSENLKRDNCHQ